jgi:hypothetical protein
MHQSRLVVAMLLAAAVVLTGCGVPLSDEAEPIPGARRPTVSPSPSPSPSAAASSQIGTATVWYVDKERLVPRSAAVPAQVTPAAVLELLGQPPAEGSGLVTLNADPVGGPPLASLPSAGPSPSVPGAAAQLVALSPTFGELTASEQVLLIGQVVLTLTEVDVAPVLFVDESGVQLSVPLPDGRLRDGPVTRGDYLALT